jgi:hypothetical protein
VFHHYQTYQLLLGYPSCLELRRDRWLPRYLSLLVRRHDLVLLALLPGLKQMIYENFDYMMILGVL